jgi:hypothetical protein
MLTLTRRICVSDRLRKPTIWLVASSSWTPKTLQHCWNSVTTALTSLLPLLRPHRVTSVCRPLRPSENFTRPHNRSLKILSNQSPCFTEFSDASDVDRARGRISWMHTIGLNGDDRRGPDVATEAEANAGMCTWSRRAGDADFDGCLPPPAG